MREEVLPRNSHDLLNDMESGDVSCWNGWTLAGGTGLALYYGHRLSADFDFFRTDAVSIDAVLARLSDFGDCEILQQYEHTLTVLLRGVKLLFFIVNDPLIAEPKRYRCFDLADILDIGLMKLVAVSGRGSRKDFIDLFFILHDKYRLNELLGLIDKKYRNKKTDKYHVLRSLTWFEDAEKEPVPLMLSAFDWDECKLFFSREAQKIILPP